MLEPIYLVLLRMTLMETRVPDPGILGLMRQHHPVHPAVVPLVVGHRARAVHHPLGVRHRRVVHRQADRHRVPAPPVVLPVDRVPAVVHQNQAVPRRAVVLLLAVRDHHHRAVHHAVHRRPVVVAADHLPRVLPAVLRRVVPVHRAHRHLVRAGHQVLPVRGVHLRPALVPPVVHRAVPFRCLRAAAVLVPVLFAAVLHPPTVHHPGVLPVQALNPASFGIIAMSM